MAVGGVRTVQRPTVSRTAGDPEPALSFQREDSIPQKLQLCQDCWCHRARGTSQHSAPVCLQSWGKEEVTKALLDVWIVFPHLPTNHIPFSDCAMAPQPLKGSVAALIVRDNLQT